MPKLTFTITEANENELRNRNRKKGNISDIINKALTNYFTAENLEKQKGSKEQ